MGRKLPFNFKVMKRIIGRKAEWLIMPLQNYINLRIPSSDSTTCDLIFRTAENLDDFSCVIGVEDIANCPGFGIEVYHKYIDSHPFRTPNYKCSKNEVCNVVVKDSNLYVNDFDCGPMTVTKTKHPMFLGSLNRFGGRVDDSAEIRTFSKCEIDNGISRLFLTPLVLTSSLPAYLASDNLPHSAGECGMWDSINEKFYGNANSTGAFSVENELDEYVEVDTTGICINGKYQRVSVENNEIPQIVWNGVNARMLVLNGKVVWDSKICEVEIYKWLYSDENNPTRVDVGAFDLSQISKIQYAESSTGIAKTAGIFDWGNTTFGRRYNRPSFTIFLNNNQLAGGTAGGTFNVDEVILDRENNKAILKRHSYGVKTCIKGEFSGAGWVNTNVEKALFTNLGETGIVGFRPQYSVIVFFKIWDLAGNLIHEFRPCKLLGTLKAEKSYDGNKHYSGELGLLDLCNNKFYPNCVENTELTLDFIIKGVNEYNTERQEKIKSIYI